MDDKDKKLTVRKAVQDGFKAISEGLEAYCNAQLVSQQRTALVRAAKALSDLSAQLTVE